MQTSSETAEQADEGIQDPKEHKSSQHTCYDYLFYCMAGQIFTLAFFLRSAIAPITDVLEEEFEATTGQIGLCSSILMFGYFAMQVPAGMTLQVYSAEFVSLTCSFMMGICAFLFTVSPNIEMATATQFLAGIAQSATSISVLTTIDKRLGSEMVPFCFGLVMGYCFLHLMLMQYLQARIYGAFHVWRPVFYFCGGTCFVLAAVSFIALTLEHNQCTQCDQGNAQKSISDTTSGITTNECTDAKATTSGEAVDLDIGDHTIHLKKLHQHQSSERQCFPIRNPMKPVGKTQSIWMSSKKALQNRLNYIYALNHFSLSFVCYGLYGLWLISYLMLKYEYKRATATLISSSMYAALALSSPFWGYLSKRYQRRKVFLVISPVLFTSSLVVIYVPDSTPMFIIVGTTIVAGLACGAWASIFWAAVRESNVHYQCEDVAVGMINSFGNSSGFISQYLIGLMLDWSWDGTLDDGGSRVYRVEDYNVAFSTLAVCIAVAFVVSLFMKETYGKPLNFGK